MIGKAHGWVTFSKCKAGFGYHLILGPLPYGFTLYFFILSISHPWTYFSERGCQMERMKKCRVKPECWGTPPITATKARGWGPIISEMHWPKGIAHCNGACFLGVFFSFPWYPEGIMWVAVSWHRHIPCFCKLLKPIISQCTQRAPYNYESSSAERGGPFQFLECSVAVLYSP